MYTSSLNVSRGYAFNILYSIPLRYRKKSKNLRLKNGRGYAFKKTTKKVSIESVLRAWAIIVERNLYQDLVVLYIVSFRY